MNNNLIESFYNWYRGALSHPKWRWAIILGTGLYLVSPFDISPDIIPIVGWIDDGILATLLVTELSSLMRWTTSKKTRQMLSLQPLLKPMMQSM